MTKIDRLFYKIYRMYIVFKINFIRLINTGENSSTYKGTKKVFAYVLNIFLTLIRMVSRVFVVLAMLIVRGVNSFKAQNNAEDTKIHNKMSLFDHFENLRYEIKHAKRTRFIPISMLASCVIMIFSYTYFGIGVEVFVDGKSYGFVENRQEILSIIHDVETQTAEYLGRPYNINADIQYSLSYVQRDRLINHEEFSQKLFSEINEVSKRYVLLMDGEVIGANNSKTKLEVLKQKLLAEKAPQIDGVQTTFVQNITVEERMVANSYLKTIEEIEQELMSNTKEVKLHDVQKGETFSRIAQQYGMSTETLKELNPDVAETRIQIGSQIRVAAAVPVLSVRSTKQISYEETIAYDVEVQYSDKMYKNESKITQKGKTGVKQVVADVVLIDGEEAERIVISEEIVAEPVLQVKVMGTKNPPPTAASGKFRWPLYGTITSRYGYRWGGEFHTGLDIAKSSGSPIVAADGGTVTLARYNGNYGYCVIIDHGNGYTSLYAHCSKLLVSRGTKVAKGQKIALVGSTGRSTGPHLHLEIRKNGNLVNPINYLK